MTRMMRLFSHGWFGDSDHLLLRTHPRKTVQRPCTHCARVCDTADPARHVAKLESATEPWQGKTHQEYGKRIS
jgi:hypothetical protein